MFGKLGRFIQRNNSKKAIMPCYTVIIVSDDPETGSRLQYILENENYMVFTASTVAECLPYLDTMLPDLLVCDFAQPEIKGKALLDTIRIRLGKTMMPPIVFLRDAPDDERLAKTFGADDLLPKPFEPGMLLACVSRLTARHEQMLARQG